MISATNDLAAAIEKKESPDKIKALAEKLKKIKDDNSSLKVSEDEAKKILEKYAKDLMAAGVRLAKAGQDNPEGAKVVSEVLGK